MDCSGCFKGSSTDKLEAMVRISCSTSLIKLLTPPYSQDADSNIYYFNFTTGESRWEHPCDDDFRKVYAEEKKKLALGSSGSREVLSETKFDPFSIKKSDSLPKVR